MAKGRQRNRPFDGMPERSQVLAVTAVAIAAAAPVIPHLDWQIGAFAGLLVALRVVSLYWPAANPGSLGLAVLTVAGWVNCVLAYRSLAGDGGGPALFVTMLALKLLEVKGGRDLRVAGTLIWFLAAVAFLFERSALLAVYLGAACIAGVAVQADLNGRLGPARVRCALATAGRMAIQAAPLTLVLFFLFPRLSAPLWALGIDTERGLTGMSERMEPGRIAELAVSGELAFRARFVDRSPAPEDLYWRGIVLWEPDRLGWSPGRDPLAASAEAPLLKRAEKEIEYEVTLEPSGQRWMFALDMPVSAPPGSLLGEGFQLVAEETLGKGKRVGLRSALDFRTAMPGPDLRDYALQLPPNVTPRMRSLADAWRASATDDWGVVQAGLEHFNRESYYYTLLPPPLGSNPADEFLFETRRGFCEHYAGSFALLMRIAGVPSRVVLGYLGGEPNRIGGYTMVWQSDAHAWVEVLIPERGWTRVDPTAAVDPARIDYRGAARLGLAGSSVRFDLDNAGSLVDLMRGARALMDNIDAAWQEWVIGFSDEHQSSLLERIGLDRHRETALVLLMVVSGSTVMGLVLIGLIRRGEPRDALTAAFRELCRRLATAGLPRAPVEGPRDYGVRVAHVRPDLAPTVEQFVEVYIAARYSPHAEALAERRLWRLLRGFRPRTEAVRHCSAARRLRSSAFAERS